jgi:peptidoglycan hydrolase-like protein with peptidoglycan-binding domain
METLAYLHLALTYEAATDAPDIDRLDSLKLFEWFKQQQLATQARMALLSLVVILGIVGMAGEALAQRPLRLGDRNPQVTFIQNRLRQLRYLDRATDGIFDRATRDAVIQFQRDRGLNPDGIVGTQTESELFAEFDRRREIVNREFLFTSSPNRTLKRGDRGSDVTAVQQRLRDLRYFNGQLTGYFGSTTQDAVIRFQQASGLQPDGFVGSETRAALFGTATATSEFYPDNSLGLPPPPPISGNFSSERFNQSPFTPVLRLGDRGSEVERLQQALRRRGFNPGRIDGIFGSQTQEAVRQFQRVNGLWPDGIAGRDTLLALDLFREPSENRYIVVVPIQDGNTLDRVRAVEGFGNAFETNSKLGKYVNAGAFPSRASAESRSYLLRSRGLDARVAYVR